MNSYFHNLISIRRSPSTSFLLFALLATALAIYLVIRPDYQVSAESPQNNAMAQNLIYTDSVQAGWSFDNIGFIDTNEFANSPVFSGTNSFEVVLKNPFSRFHFVADTPFSVSDYDSISFQLFGSDPGQTLSFELWDSGFNPLGEVAVPITVNSWSAVTIDFSNFAASNDVTYVQFSNASTTSPIYLDNVFLGDPDSTPPPTATFTATPSATNTPSPTVTPTSTPVVNPTATPVQGTPEFIYADEIAVDWTLGGAGPFTQDPNATNKVYAGTTSLELVFEETFAFAYFQADSPFDPAKFGSLNFALQGDDVGQTFNLELATGNFTSLNFIPIEISNTSWNEFSISMDQFSDAQLAEYIMIRNVSSDSPIYLDNVNIVRTEAELELTNSIFLPVGVRE